MAKLIGMFHDKAESNKLRREISNLASKSILEHREKDLVRSCFHLALLRHLLMLHVFCYRQWRYF